jgi:uncharacterized membrane protein YcgQ (UPF0703/DUF1980 family)
MQDIPVYLFTGFLESGKTKFIQDIMEDGRFNNGEKTLLLLCEEGIEEYDISRFYGKNVNIKPVENEEDLTEKNLKLWLKENNAERVVIEYNGMWQLKTLFENIPRNWTIYQTFSFADYTTFKMFNSNIRSLVFERIANTDTVIFNRVPRGFDMMEIHQIVRAINTRVNIAYEYEDGETEYDEIEDPLPFDIDAPVVEIKDDDFALFYRDLIEDEMKYNGKTVKFKGIIAVEPKFGKGVFAIGRHIMSCCADDIQYGCLVAKTTIGAALKSREWLEIVAEVKIEYHAAYQEKGPVLYVKEMKRATKPENEVVTF